MRQFPGLPFHLFFLNIWSRPSFWRAQGEEEEKEEEEEEAAIHIRWDE